VKLFTYSSNFSQLHNVQEVSKRSPEDFGRSGEKCSSPL
jgi:hypothetical protein